MFIYYVYVPVNIHVEKIKKKLPLIEDLIYLAV